MTNRLTFLSHFVICLAIAAIGFFAWLNGVPQAIYHNDLSMMTSVIAALFVVTAAQIGWQAWHVDDPREFPATRLVEFIKDAGGSSSHFGHLATLLFPAIGMLGTITGLSLQFKALSVAAAPFEALRTALFPTGCGIAAMILTMVMVHSLEAGIRRARR